MLFALRYQKTQQANIANLINLLLENGVSREDARVCRVFFRNLPERLAHFVHDTLARLRVSQHCRCRPAPG